MKKFFFICAVVVVILLVRNCGKSSNDLKGEWGCYNKHNGQAYSLTIKSRTLIYAEYSEQYSVLYEYNYARSEDTLRISLAKISEDGGATWERVGGDGGLISFRLVDKLTLEFDGKTYIKSSELLKDKKFFNGTWTALAFDKPEGSVTVTFDGNSFSQHSTHEADIQGKVIRDENKTTYEIKRYCEDGKNWKKADRNAKIKSEVLILDRNHFLDKISLEEEFGVITQIYTRTEK